MKVKILLFQLIFLIALFSTTTVFAQTESVSTPDADKPTPPSEPAPEPPAPNLDGSSVYVQLIKDAPGMGEYRWYNQDFGWTHTFDLTDVKIVKATLEIYAWDVDLSSSELDIVYADGKKLGNLIGGDSLWYLTRFDIPIELLADGKLDIWLDIDSTHPYYYWAVTIGWSRLVVVYQRVIHVVKGNPNAKAPYANWATAASSIRDALAIASPGDPIVVRTEEYRDWGLEMKSGVMLVSEAALQIAGIKTGPDKVSLEELAKFKPKEQLPLKGQEKIILPAIDGFNTDTIIYSINNAVNTYIIGFKLIEGGNLYGGGIKCENSKVNIIFNEFDDNRAKKSGGGIYLTNSPLEIYNNTFSSCYAHRGGALSIEDTFYESIKVYKCHFKDNYSLVLGGGGIFIRNSIVDIKDCTFENNSAKARVPSTEELSEVSGIPQDTLKGAFGLVPKLEEYFLLAYSFGSGGAIFGTGIATKITIEDSSIGKEKSANISSRDGGGIEAIGGIYFWIEPIIPRIIAIPVGGTSFEIMGKTCIQYNSADDDGGGISFTNGAEGKILAKEVRIENNKATNNGGGIHLTGRAEVTIENGIGIYHNIAESGSGGGIYLRDSSQLKVSEGCEIGKNKAKDGGGGIYVYRELPPTLTILGITMSPFEPVNWGPTYFDIKQSVVRENRIQSGQGGGIAIVHRPDEPGNLMFVILANTIYGNYFSTVPFTVQPGAPTPLMNEKFAEINTGPAGGIFLKDAYKPVPLQRNLIGKNSIECNSIVGIKSVDSISVGDTFEVKNNKITENHIGLTIVNSSPSINNNRIERNGIYGLGRGLQLVNSSSEIYKNQVTKTKGGQIEIGGRGEPRVTYNHIDGGGISLIGIFAYGKTLPIVNKCNIFGHNQGGLVAVRREEGFLKLDARYNWWGDERGPFYAREHYIGRPGKRDAIIVQGKGSVDFEPYEKSMIGIRIEENP